MKARPLSDEVNKHEKLTKWKKKVEKINGNKNSRTFRTFILYNYEATLLVENHSQWQIILLQYAQGKTWFITAMVNTQNLTLQIHICVCIEMNLINSCTF